MLIGLAPAALSGPSFAQAEPLQLAAEVINESTFVALSSLVVPVFRNGKVEGHIGWRFTIEASNPAAAQKIRDTLPRLTDAFVSELHSLAQRHVTAEGTLDGDLVKRRLLAASARLYGADVVRAVLISASFTRKIG